MTVSDITFPNCSKRFEFKLIGRIPRGRESFKNVINESLNFSSKLFNTYKNQLLRTSVKAIFDWLVPSRPIFVNFTSLNKDIFCSVLILPMWSK